MRNDTLIPKIVWQNLHPLLDSKEHAARFIELVTVDRLRNLRHSSRSRRAPWTDYSRLQNRPRPLRGTDLATRPGRHGRGGQRGEAGCPGNFDKNSDRRAFGGEFGTPALAVVADPATLLEGPVNSPLRFELALLATSLKDPAATRPRVRHSCRRNATRRAGSRR